MPKRIDWMYERKNCATCKKARAFLDEVSGKVLATEDAAKVKYAFDEARKLLEGMERVVALKGDKVVTLKLTSKKEAPPDDETLQKHLLGPTGNLRAPTAKVGKTLLVGFNEEGYKAVLGIKEDA